MGREKRGHEPAIKQCHHAVDHLRRFRGSQKIPGRSYGKALGAGLYLLLIASAVYAIYTYALYASSDELFSTYKTNMLETLKLVYEGTPIYNTLLETFNMFLMPVSIAMGEFFNHIVTGGIFTVLLAWFVKRKPQDFQQQV